MTKANEMNAVVSNREIAKANKRMAKGRNFAKDVHYLKVRKAAKKGKTNIKVVVPFKCSPISAKNTFVDLGYKVEYVRRDIFDRVVYRICW
jgi:hypothetical protein